MTRFQEKAQGQVKQMVGQMIRDDQLVLEGKEQQRKADGEKMAENADQGILRDQKGEEQPKDKERAQTAHPKARKGPLLG